MVQINVVRSCNSNLIKTQPLVAVFIGGTSGIGEYTIRALATAHSDQGKGLRLYIVGRNADAAKATISDCVRVCPGGQFRFMQAEDLALLKDVDRVCAEIIRIEEDENVKGGTARVDLLVMSQAYLSFEPRRAPLLLASPLPAHVVSVYGAGKEGKLFPEDLSLRDPKHYGFSNARSHVVYMTTFFMEALAERHRGRLSLIHVFPGLVMTAGFDSVRLPTWFKLIWRWVAAPIVWPFTVPPRECGERILFLATPRSPARQTIETGTSAKGDKATATEGDAGIAMGSDGSRGSGAYAVNWDGETIPTEKAYKKVREEDFAGKVWDHTMRTFEEIEAGTVFTG